MFLHIGTPPPPVLIIELLSGGISGAQNENIAQNINMEMVRDIREVIDKRVGIFSVEEQKLRKELLNELALMKEDNSRLRDNLTDLKLLISSQDKFVKAKFNRRRGHCCQWQPCCQQQQNQYFCKRKGRNLIVWSRQCSQM